MFHARPEYFSKNFISFSIIACFLAVLAPPNRETGGMILSIDVPVVFKLPYTAFTGSDLANTL